MEQYIKELPISSADKILQELLSKYTEPSFGVLPKSEINLIFLEALIETKYISENPSVYELVSKLKITNTRARTLIYERELRKFDTAKLDEKLVEILCKPIIEKNGKLFLFEIENPLLIDHLKSKLKVLGCLSDGSFSPSIVRLSSKAFIELVDNCLNAQNQSIAMAVLKKSGITEPNFKTFLYKFIEKVGSKLADETGEELVKEFTGYVRATLNGLSIDIPKIKELLEKK